MGSSTNRALHAKRERAHAQAIAWARTQPQAKVCKITESAALAAQVQEFLARGGRVTREKPGRYAHASKGAGCTLGAVSRKVSFDYGLRHVYSK